MDFLIAVLATYCATYFITQLDGPFGLLWKLRHIKWLGALHCFSCTSIYVSAIIALYGYHTLLEWLLHTLAIAGAAIIINELIERI